MFLVRYMKSIVLKHKLFFAFYTLCCVALLRKLKQLTRPFSDDTEFLKNLPVAIFRLCKRRWQHGPVFPEWPFAFEFIQCIMKCVGDFHGEKMVVPTRNAILFRESLDQLLGPIVWLYCQHHGLQRETVLVDQVRCEWLKPKVTSTTADARYAPYVLFYVHGGAYVAFSPTTHLNMVHRIMKSIQHHLKISNSNDQTDVHTFFVDYRKAPEHVFPAAVEDALAAYNYLTMGLQIPPNRIIIAGDSAGGGLTLSLLLRLRKQKREMPAAAVCISPLVDLKGFGADCDHDIVSMRQAVMVKQVYLSDYEDPSTWGEAAPIMNNLTKLPPLLIQVGDKEMLYPQCLRLAARAHADGTETVLDVHKNMPHIFTFFDDKILPQSRLGIDKIGKFAAYHFHNQLPPKIPVNIRRNVSSYQLGERDCFIQPHYLLSKGFEEQVRRVYSESKLTATA